jgi:aminoglycoside phosphotransferase (APT) family kinase protein
MPSETPSIDRSEAARVLRRADVDFPGFGPSPVVSEASLASVGDGFNDVFAVPPPGSRENRFAIKFGSYSKPSHFRAGVAAYRLLSAYTALPVPMIYAADVDEEATPPFVVMDYCPGAPLAAGFRDVPSATDPDAVRLLGAVVDAFTRIPEHAAEGYGPIRDFDAPKRERGPRAAGEHDDWAAWLVDYASGFYADPPAHPALEAVAPRALKYLRANRDRLPSTPSRSIVLTDLSPGNLLSPDGDPPDSVNGLTGLIDLERAKLGPVEFTAVNAEYLLTRYVSNPNPVRDALYAPLPFGPELRWRDLYRIVAMGRSVGALSAWYEPGSETYRRRGDTVAAALRQIID